MRQRLTSKISIIAASALTLGTCLPAGIAFADPEADPTPPYVGNQSGAGSTALTMVWENPDAEYGGTEYETGDYANPDNDNPKDGLGDNLAFKAPTAINFVAKANGTLQGPSAGAAKIENFSNYGVRVSSLDIDAASNDWNIVADASGSNAANAVSGLIGPSGDQLSWQSYLNKTDVSKPHLWNLDATDGADDGSDELPLTVSGKVANLNINLSTAQTFATIHWYLKAGSAAPPAAPTLPTSLDGVFTENASLSNLSAVGNYLRSGNADSSYITSAESLVGNTINVTLHDNNSYAFRLVDVNTTRGLTFESVYVTSASYKWNSTSTNEGGWAESDLRKSMNMASFTDHSEQLISNGLYATYLQGTALDADGIVHSVSNSSNSYNSDPNLSTDKYWIASMNNICGPNWRAYGSSGTYTDGAGEIRFDYYAQDTEGTAVLKKTSADDSWDSSWNLRSADPGSNEKFQFVNDNGIIYNNNAHLGYHVAICFCL